MKTRLFALAGLGLLAFTVQAAELLNVSYDPTRELYKQLNENFVAHWKANTGETVAIRQSHGGSSAQARKVLDGLEADVATLGIASDIDLLADKAGLLPTDWQKRLPGDSAPYHSTIVFLVRHGNPKSIKDWGDLAKPGIKVITPNPKTSAGARWNFLAAYAWALRQNDNDETRAKAWISQLFNNVPVLDTGARGATVTFAQRRLGDVLVAWENEAQLALSEFDADKFEIVVPSLSILAQPPVALIDKNAKKHGTEKLADAYLRFLYTPQAQEIIAKNHFRPFDPTVAAHYAASFPKIESTTIDQFGGWKAAQAKFFADGGVFDQIYEKK